MSRKAHLHCQVDLTHWSQYSEGDLSAFESRRCQAHLDECAECRRTLAELRRLLQSCRKAGRQALPRTVGSQARRRARHLLHDS